MSNGAGKPSKAATFPPNTHRRTRAPHGVIASVASCDGQGLDREPALVRSTRTRAPVLHGVIRAHAPHGVKRPTTGKGISKPGRVGRRRCEARTRPGTPCKRKALPNGRCPNHGGLSTGAKTVVGRERIAAAQRARWARWKLDRAHQEDRP